MKRTLHLAFLSLFVWITLNGTAQEVVSPFQWKVRSSRTGPNQYELIFSTTGSKPWQLYAPNQTLSDIPVAELQLGDSSFILTPGFKDSGTAITLQSAVFDTIVRLYEGPATWKARVTINGTIPADLKGNLLYSYGKGDEFYPSTSFSFTVPLEGGVTTDSKILIANLNLKNPVSPCGDDETGDKSLWTLFFIGLGAGLLALLFPCVFPLIPLTVSFFTKRAQSRRKGIMNAIWYGTSIFLIYTLLSLPFHIFNVQPEVLNNISTNVPLNLAFFTVFVVFAISFFGYFEITLPSGIANKADAKSGLGDILGIFFMALTLAIVSFSCTSGILGALLVGALNGPNGAWQLTAGMAGFGLGLGLPFILFALFPNWLQSLPKSGGWMNELKAVFGFIELAMAVKFLSNADLVMQWHLLQREVFIAIWILIGLAIVLYLTGVFRFANDSKVKFTPIRIIFIVLFGGLTLALIPGVTNTRSARLGFISGFPPPFSYSVYKHPVNYETGVEPLHNDYEKALQLAREQHKPVLIDFTGWACVNCRRMEENVWVDEEVKELMKNRFIVVSLYVDERKKLPVTQQFVYKGKNGSEKSIVTVGDKWATFQSENFNAVAQPQYAIINPDERALTKTKAYTPTAAQFRDWLQCGLDAFEKEKKN
ncbi:MAG TPA: thioredoxin family protein [Flavisolibacter sp.]|jgi:thiol:disulfide interchange protein DsbD|nr:thioredoxin family protein [Flavisolibacter sp.]